MRGGIFMDDFHVYKDIEARTGGEIYIGVVGPVRTGKSTFIKRFMELLVLPKLPDGQKKAQTRDELPQSAAGKTIMTTEPKFIPKEAAELDLAEGIRAKVRLIDCVGFMVEGAAGHMENGEERVVKTPWYDYEIPFTRAAEIGTRKVIRDHSTIGIVVVCDGSFGELSREDFKEAEEQTISELKEIGKPFLILLNSTRPYAAETKALALKLENQYGVPVRTANCEQLKKEDIEEILSTVLLEFPVTELDFEIPKWVEILPDDHALKKNMIAEAEKLLMTSVRMKHVPKETVPENGQPVKKLVTDELNLASGRVTIRVLVDDGVYFEVLSDISGLPVQDEYSLFQILKESAAMQGEYEKVKNALAEVRQKGYGIVLPDKTEISLDEPELIRHGSKYGVKIHAQAPSINLIKARIETEIAPIVGNEQQAKDLIQYIDEGSQRGESIWETNIFGKSIEQLVQDGIRSKIAAISEESQVKLQDTMQKIVNDSKGGLVCIII